MDNFYTYLKWRGDLTFANAPFNEVDNLLLSQIAYVDFNDIVKGTDECYSITISDAMHKLKKRYDEDGIKNMPKLPREWLEIFYAIASSKRFMNQHMSCYVKEIDAVSESQFAAIRIDLDDNSTYIAYSGTDTSVVGWKENFNMTFLEATPGQKKATKYLETVTEDLYRIIRVGGHSKGGNLAVYAAMHARSEVRDKITCIYNNDGPGFTKKMILKEAYKEILPRIHTFVPQSSLIGMLLMHEENIEMIKSSNVGLMQHDAVSWGVMGDSFLKVDNREKSMVKIDKTLKKWVEGLSDSEREKFIDILFSTLERAKIYDIDILSAMPVDKLISLIKSYDELSTDSKKYIKRTVKLLVDTWVDLTKKDNKSSIGGK